jgi:YteA family regulatory protein
MDRDKLEYFRKRLYEERDNIYHILEGLEEEMGVETSLRDSTSELSSYDNHPGDLASETFEIEKNRALRANETTHLAAIDDALGRIDSGRFGKCEICGREIAGERLDALPYARTCIECEKTREPNYKTCWQDRPVEETVIGYPFGSINKDPDDYTGYDGEDVWQELESFNSPNLLLWDDEEDENMQGVVEEVDKISNEQYRRQLPD